MTAKTKMYNRLLSMLLCLAMLITFIPVPTFTAQAAASATVADPGTADSWESMMGTESDGNRYAGRVWADKSVYTQGQTVKLNSSNNAGSSFAVSLEDDEAFQVVFSVLGSSMSTTSTTSTTGPMDVVLVLDTSTSMDDYTDGNVTRLQKVIEAANMLLDDLLTINNVRIAIVTYNYDSETVIGLDSYNNGIDLVVTNYLNNGRNGAGVVYAYDDDDNLLGKDSGYTMGTNLQAGIDRGFNILANAQNVEGRIPVAIVLTDGQANRAVRASWYDLEGNSISTVTDERLYLSTMLNAAYNKTKVEANYGAEQKVYSISVDLDEDSEAHALMNPADPTHGFNANNSHQDISDAYDYFLDWAAGETVNIGTNNNNRWTFNHNYPTPNGITRQDIAENINYVSEDAYYDVSSAELEDTFTQIYEELSSGAFNPISSSTTVDGATGVDNTPLIYVDHIGKHMEVKEIQSVTLFGSSYGVVKNADGTYTVQAATGTNPTTKESWNTAEDIKISVTENSDGTQKLQVNINQEILPIILEQVAEKTVAGQTAATITELSYDPLRVYYTIGLDSDILLPNGDIDVSKIQGYGNINNTTGEITFYSNRFGVENTVDNNNNGFVDMGDAHIGFEPSAENRYYYYQTNQDILLSVEPKAPNTTIEWEEDEYGVRYEQGKYNYTWLNYEKYKTLSATDIVYTYVTYYHPTADLTDAATAAEQVTYIIRPQWSYLKESVAFFDYNAKTYVNYNEATNGYVTGEIGYAMPVDKVEATLAAYLQANPNAEIYCRLGIGSLRTSRLHNMEKDKLQNNTGTADMSYDPVYTHERASNHNDNDVVIWLGNNGKLTTKVDTGIALTKAVTEPIGTANDTYALTVTVPGGVTAAPVVKNADGKTLTSSYQNNVLTVNVKAGETVYISGIPAGTVCTIGEIVNGDYHIESKTDTVTVPTLGQVLAGQPQFAPATVTNAPNKYGSVIIGKEVVSAIADHQNKEFAFSVTLTGNDLVANKDYVATRSDGQTYNLKANTAATITLKHHQYVTIEGLPGGTVVTAIEQDYSGVGFTVNQATQTATVAVDDVKYLNYQNTYAPQSVTNGSTVVVNGSKNLEANANLSAQFQFKLQRYVWADSSYEDITGGTASASYSNEKGVKSFSFDFSGEPYTAAGTYYYRIVEIEDAALEAAGIVFDLTPAYFSVVVSDDGQGKLYISDVVAGTDATVAKSGNVWTVTGDFVNTYSVDGAVEVTLNIKKTIKAQYGVTIPPAGFSFDLYESNDQWTEGALVKTSSVTGAGGLSDIPLVFDDPVNDIGKHYYVIKENIPAQQDDRITYSTQKYGVLVDVGHEAGHFTVTVTAYDLNGQTPVLKETVNGIGTAGVITANMTALEFENWFTPDEVNIDISGTKTLIGKDSATGFTFEVVPENGQTDTATTSAHTDGVAQTIDFNGWSYRTPGVYRYQVREKIPADAVNNVKDGITYDASEYLVTVTVTGNDQTGELTLDYTITKDGVPANIEFVNTYEAKPTEYTLSGTKILEGRAPADEEFTFELWEGSNKLETVKNKADGTFTFKTIEYMQPGTHTYTIKEKEGNSPGVTYNGVNAPVTVVVTVTDENAELKAEANIANANIKFVNTYTPAAAKVTFNGSKKLDGGTLTDNSFTFKLYETDHTFNIAGLTPKDTEKNVSGSFAFDTVSFNKTGTFFYAVVEDASVDPMAEVVYDGTQHNFRVRVSDVGDGQLRAVVTNLATGVSTASAATATVSAAFTNATFDEVTEKEVYLQGSTTEIDGQKVNAGDILTYFIKYTNYTGEPVAVDIVDTIPQHTSYVDGSASHNGTYAGTHVNWVLSVAAGESVEVHFSVKVDETEEIFANTAVVYDGVNTYHTNEVVNHTVEEPAKKDVMNPADITASIDGKKVYAGDELLYVISYTNASANPANVIITDKIPQYTAYVEGSADNGGVYTNGTLTWSIADAPAWETVKVSFKVKVSDNIGAQTIENQATAEAGNRYTTNKVTNYTVEDEVEKKVYLAGKTQNIDGKKVSAGDELQYAISYKNTSAEKVTVTITDTIPENTTYLPGSADKGGVYGNGVVTWTLDVEAGQAVTVTFKVRVDNGSTGTLSNKAVVVEGKNSYTTNEVKNEITLPKMPDTPDTGDNTNLGLWFALLVISGMGLMGTAVFGRKRREFETR